MMAVILDIILILYLIIKKYNKNVVSIDEQNNMKWHENPDSLMSKCKMTKKNLFL